MGKNLLVYTVAGTAIGGVMEWGGVNPVASLIASLLLPPLILLAVRLARYYGYL